MNLRSPQFEALFRDWQPGTSLFLSDRGSGSQLKQDNEAFDKERRNLLLSWLHRQLSLRRVPPQRLDNANCIFVSFVPPCIFQID